MGITPKNVIRHELIGLKVRVIKAKNPANIGIAGKIINETYHTLVIESEDKEKRVFKEHITIILQLPGKTKVEVEGKLLVARPWDRIKKKIK